MRSFLGTRNTKERFLERDDTDEEKRGDSRPRSPRRIEERYGKWIPKRLRYQGEKGTPGPDRDTRGNRRR